MSLSSDDELESLSLSESLELESLSESELELLELPELLLLDSDSLTEGSAALSAAFAGLIGLEEDEADEEELELAGDGDRAAIRRQSQCLRAVRSLTSSPFLTGFCSFLLFAGLLSSSSLLSSSELLLLKSSVVSCLPLRLRPPRRLRLRAGRLPAAGADAATGWSGMI